MPVNLPKDEETLLGPNPFQEHWEGTRDTPGPLADPSGDDAAAASADSGEQGHGDTGLDDSWLTEEERAQLDPNDPTYQLLMRAMARKSQVEPQAQDPHNDLQSQMELLKLQQEIAGGEQSENPDSDMSLWDGFAPTAEFPPELKDYEDVIMSRVRDAANHVVSVLQRRADVQAAQERNQTIRTRLSSEVSELLRGPAAQEFRKDMGAVMAAVRSPAGRELLMDPTMGLKGVWNLLRVQQGRAPFTPAQAQAKATPRPVFAGDKRNHAVERTVPSVSQSQPAAPPLPTRASTRDWVEQAFAQAVEQAKQRQR